ncbi:hypothetical protein B0H11DRAFT_2287384 [Mycena galericulata]|nr:hypothetical protein B0H11DRAFT_2287384 [Mycena galericulata]
MPILPSNFRLTLTATMWRATGSGFGVTNGTWPMPLCWLVVPEIHLAHHCRTHCDSAMSTCPIHAVSHAVDLCLPSIN